MANRSRDLKREIFWRWVIKRQRAVELTVRAFCRQEQLSEASFYAWRRTILERDAEAERSQPASSVPAVQPTFLPVLLNDNGHQEGGIAIELAGGRRLRLSESIPPQRLAEIVWALERTGVDADERKENA